MLAHNERIGESGGGKANIAAAFDQTSVMQVTRDEDRLADSYIVTGSSCEEFGGEGEE
jgi:hypothetical protein